MKVCTQTRTSTMCVREERALLAVAGSPFCVPLHLHTGRCLTGVFTESDSALTRWSLSHCSLFYATLLKPQRPEGMSGSWGSIFLFHHWVEHPAFRTLVRVFSSPGRQSLLCLHLGQAGEPHAPPQVYFSKSRYSGLGFINFVFLPKHIVLFLCYCAVMFILDYSIYPFCKKKKDARIIYAKAVVYV